MYRASAGGLNGLKLPEGGEPSPLRAPQLIANVQEDSRVQVSVVAVGPLTNIAKALRARAEITGRIDAIYVAVFQPEPAGGSAGTRRHGRGRGTLRVLT